MKSQKIIAVVGICVILGFVGYLLTNYPINLADFITQLSVGLIFASVGLAVWGFKDDIERLLGKIPSDKIITEKQYDYKKLNNEVFKKLINILCLEYPFYFGSEFGFCISAKLIELNIWEFFEFHSKSSTRSIRSKEFEEEFKPINEAIPTLIIGEKYLEKHYADVYKNWMNIKSELEKINKERQEFFKKTSLRIMKSLKKEFKTSPLLLLSPHGNDWAYFEDNILLVLPIFFRKMTIAKLDVDNEVDNQSYVCFERLRLVGFNKLPDGVIETIKHAFNSTISDRKLEAENGEFYVRLYSVNTKLVSFSKEIEDKVVNDIDNMV
jgi:hypothetical protein